MIELLVGNVNTYDFERGLGVVSSSDGRRWVFHCTAIADGTRRIDPGTRVAFSIAASGPGTWEAHRLTIL